MLRHFTILIQESLSTLTNRQYDSRLGVSSGEIRDPAELPDRSLGGLAIVASFISDQRDEGSGSPTAQALTGVTFSIPFLESISAFYGSLKLSRFHRALNRMFQPSGQSDGQRSLIKLILNPIG